MYGAQKIIYLFLLHRYGEIGDYMLELNQYANKSLGCLKKLKRQTDLASVLSKPFNVLSAYLHLKENFEDHHKTQQQQLEQSIDYLDELKDVDELREYYEFLHTRYIYRKQTFIHAIERLTVYNSAIFCLDRLKIKKMFFSRTIDHTTVPNKRSFGDCPLVNSSTV